MEKYSEVKRLGGRWAVRVVDETGPFDWLYFPSHDAAIQWAQSFPYPVVEVESK